MFRNLATATLVSLAFVPSVSAETLEADVIDTQPLIRVADVRESYLHCETKRDWGYVPPQRSFKRDLLGYLFANPQPTLGDYGVKLKRVCEDRIRVTKKSVIDGYLVTYTLNGKMYQTRTVVDPGKKMQITVKHEVR